MGPLPLIRGMGRFLVTRLRTCKSALQPVRGVIHFSKKGRCHERRFLVDRGAAFASASLLSEAEGEPRVDDRKVLSGIIYIQRNGLMWSEG